MSNIQRLLRISLIWVLAAMVTACGGGSSTDIAEGGGALTASDERRGFGEEGESEHEGDEDHEDGSPGAPPAPAAGGFTIVAANDLGMHCADLDYRIFSILPPFNVVHAQVLRRGTESAGPELLDSTLVEVLYSAASNPDDPVGSSSLNTTSQNLPGAFKTNFWEPSTVASTIGGTAYGPLYPSVLAVEPTASCATTFDCPSVLSLFEPIPFDLGIPVPDPKELPELHVDQQAMPGLANSPQVFDRFDRDLPFFQDFPFGTVVQDINWFAADGIPIMPVDDSGRVNAYPLMKVAAHDLATGDELASIDVVLPVASEADCQNCHVDPLDCLDPGLPAEIQSDSCNGTGVPSNGVTIDEAPGDTREQQLLNAAKINILRLHDLREGASYENWDGDGNLVSMPCDGAADPSDPDCLANQTPIQCSRCHYSPALDLAQIGPLDEPAQGLLGRQQAHHISMSRAMHEFHGRFSSLFPSMPEPNGRDPNTTLQVLEETCYQCHPGKRTQCLRGAMFAGGVVCQDCHGDMTQVGNDFSGAFPDTPFPAGADLTKRVPWANEPQCQSCHIGDVLALASLDTSDYVLSDDGIRLLQSYTVSDSDQSNLPFISAPESRFAENESLYRLSKGHGGLMCEACHGSTHAIWPIQNAFANDNVAANQLQGHTGTIIECTACHAAGSLALTLSGPHGMHPVGDPRWNEEHEELAERDPDACRACHGLNGEGSVLARMATTRTLECDEGPRCNSNERITLLKGEQVSCDLCHENELSDSGHH